MEKQTDEQINQEIHEKLFGECWHDETTDSARVWKCGKCGLDRRHCENPDYCNDIAATWRVVEKMTADGWFWTISHELNADYGAEFNKTANHFFVGVDAKLPRAICEAALETLDPADDTDDSE
jgi:hypothetical protein